MIETIQLMEGVTVLARRLLRGRNRQVLSMASYANRAQTEYRIRELVHVGVRATCYRLHDVFYVRIHKV